MSNEEYQPTVNALLNADGSITTFDGTVVSSANAAGAKEYKKRAPIANKFINSDGSIHTLDEISNNFGVRDNKWHYEKRISFDGSASIGQSDYYKGEYFFASTNKYARTV